MPGTSRLNLIFTLASIVVLIMIWGMVPIIAQELVGPPAGFSGWQVAAGRLLPAACLGLLLGLAVDRRRLLALWGIRDDGGPYGRWRPLVLIGLAFGAYFLHTAVMALGKTYEVPAGTVALIVALITPCTALLAWLTRTEYVGGRKIVGITLAFLGLYVAVHFGANQEIGFRYVGVVLFMLLSPIAGACYVIYAKPLIKHYGTLMVVSSMMVAGAVPAAWFWLQTDLVHHVVNLSAWHWMLFLYMVLLAHFGGQFIWLHALKVIEPSKLVMAIYAVPIISLVGDHLLGRRELSWPLVAGAAVLITGVALAGSAPRRPRAAGKEEAESPAALEAEAAD
jgi:O-acetylserine/cysteine efflux transporter